jgi:hypothetical protein
MLYDWLALVDVNTWIHKSYRHTSSAPIPFYFRLEEALINFKNSRNPYVGLDLRVFIQAEKGQIHLATKSL